LVKKNIPYLQQFKPSWSIISNNENTVFPMAHQQTNEVNHTTRLQNPRDIVVPNYNIDPETHNEVLTINT
ncbi:25862_t:CDS:1, partial [Gigaspora rosea]